MKVLGTSFKEVPGQWHAGLFCSFASYTLEFELDSAVQLGRVAFHGDRRTFLVAKLNDNTLVQIKITHQAKEHQKELKKLLDKMPFVGRPSSHPFHIKWQETK